MRNGTGVFAIVNPILVGRLRSSSAVNTNFTDAGGEITNTLPLDGTVGMDTGAQIKASNGSTSAPGISFGADRNLGFRRRGTNGMAWVAGGADRLYNDTDGKLWHLGAMDIAGAAVVNGVFTGGDTGAIEALEGTGLARRTATNTWSLDDGTCEITFVRNGNGTVLPTGILGDIRVPFACTITGITLLADQSGSCVLDIWKDTLANFPPTNSDSITSSSNPSISAATSYSDTTLSSWTTSITAGDVLRFNLDSISTITRLAIILTVKRFT